MVHSSNPRLMNRVLDAVVHLCEGKGSTARDVLDFLRQTSKGTSRNLTMQVHRALKHAVNAGLLRHRSGRYKALFTLNPAPVKQQPSLNECNEGKSVAGVTVFDADQPTARVTSDRKEENRGKHKRSRHERKPKRSRSHQRKRKRRSGSRRRDNDPTEHIGEIRKPKYKEKGDRDRSSRRRISNKKMKMDIASTSTCNHKRCRKGRDEEYYSDVSDSSEYEDADAKPRAPARQGCKCDGTGKQARRSVSRNRSPQRQQSQQLQAKRSRDDVKGSKTDSDDRRNGDPNDEPDQDVEKDREPNNSGSGSTL